MVKLLLVFENEKNAWGRFAWKHPQKRMFCVHLVIVHLVSGDLVSCHVDEMLAGCTHQALH